MDLVETFDRNWAKACRVGPAEGFRPDTLHADNYIVREAVRLGLLDVCRVYSDCIDYRGYVISYDPPPIPDRRWDWQFVHTQYDGAPDSGDHRHGEAASLGAAMAEIDDQISEEAA